MIYFSFNVPCVSLLETFHWNKRYKMRPKIYCQFSRFLNFTEKGWIIKFREYTGKKIIFLWVLSQWGIGRRYVCLGFSNVCFIFYQHTCHFVWVSLLTLQDHKIHSPASVFPQFPGTSYQEVGIPFCTSA